MSKLGMILGGGYALLALVLVLTQGLFGESFIAIILGLPWTLLLSFFEFFGAEGPLLVILLVLPMVINAYLLYRLGKFISRKTA